MFLLSLQTSHWVRWQNWGKWFLGIHIMGCHIWNTFSYSYCFLKHYRKRWWFLFVSVTVYPTAKDGLVVALICCSKLIFSGYLVVESSWCSLGSVVVGLLMLMYCCYWSVCLTAIAVVSVNLCCNIKRWKTSHYELKTAQSSAFECILTSHDCGWYSLMFGSYCCWVFVACVMPSSYNCRNWLTLFFVS